MLENINSPSGLKELPLEKLPELCGELRRYMVDGLKNTGGHLASNLGAVELAVALHYVFDSPADKIIFDVGHQCYVHKILTGRREEFLNIRREGGIGGFPRMEESPHDAFGTGHSSTAVSAALGMARARDLQGGEFHVVAVLGDGALAGGMAYEALNDAGHSQAPLIVILNDNRMSISKTPGAVSRHLARLRIRPKYASAKLRFKNLVLSLPYFGRDIYAVFNVAKKAVRRAILPNILFEHMGLKYVGPIDGHNLSDLIGCFEDAKIEREPLLIHVMTQKGKGLLNAEEAPELYHSVELGVRSEELGIKDGEQKINDKAEVNNCAASYAPHSSLLTPQYNNLFSEALGKHLSLLAAGNPLVTAITAGMEEATGLSFFREKHPDRFFDVGIAEQHAVTLAAGMAAGGLRPVVAIYSTFLQRAYDQILHDVCLQKLPVVFLIDRAGISGADGRTHQGIFDLSFLASMPGAVICAPADIAEAELMLKAALSFNRPTFIRYPKYDEYGVYAQITYYKASQLSILNSQLKNGHEIAQLKWGVVKEGKSPVTVLCAGGRMLEAAFEADKILKKKKLDMTIVNARFVSPIDVELIKGIIEKQKNTSAGKQKKSAGNQPPIIGHLIISMEDGIAEGGFGSSLRPILADLPCRFIPMALPEKIIEHCKPEDAFRRYGLDAEGLVKTIIHIK